MSDFSNAPLAVQPTWTGVTAADNTFVPLSGTGQVQILGGYGLGSFDGGDYGEGDETVISTGTVLNTVWTPVTDR